MVTDMIIDEQLGQDKPAFHATEAQILAFDRRRAGRREVSPVLVPLLREPASAAPGFDHVMLTETPYRDLLESEPTLNPLAPARGIALGLSISMLFWGVVGYAIFR
jgi:hypothetical protein